MTTKNIVLQKARLAGDINNDGVIDKFDVDLLRETDEAEADALEAIVRDKFFDVNATINAYETDWYKGQNENMFLESVSMPKSLYTVSNNVTFSHNVKDMYPKSYVNYRVISYNQSGTDDIVSYKDIPIKSGGTYTFSFMAKGSGTIEAHFDGEGDFLPCVHSINSKGYESTSETGKSEFQLTNSWTRYWVTIQLRESSDRDVHTLRRFVLKHSSSVNCEIGALKMEEGSVATAYCPNKKDKYGLQVFLPLQNEITNYGIADIIPEVTGNASYTDMYYGKGFLSSSYNNIVFDNPITKQTETQSISMYVMFSRWSATNTNAILHGFDENGLISLSYSNTAKLLSFASKSYSDGSSISMDIEANNVELELNHLYHIWVVRDVAKKITLDGTTYNEFRMYLDGVLIATTPITSDVGAPAKLRIGSDGLGNYFNGAIRDVQIYTNCIPSKEQLIKSTFDSHKYDSSFRDVSGRWVYDSDKQVYKTTFDTEEGQICTGTITLSDDVDVPDIVDAYCDSTGIVTVEVKRVPRYDLDCVINYETGGDGSFYYKLTSDFYDPASEYENLTVDSYIEHYDVGTLDIPFANRYKELDLKESLTSEEETEKQGLFAKLRNKLFLSSDMTKVQDSLVSIQRYFSRLVHHEIEDKITDYETIIDNYDNSFDEVLLSLQETTESINNWAESTKQQIHDYHYFDFDNLVYMNTNGTHETISDDGIWLETLSCQDYVASRETIKNGEGDFTVNLTYRLSIDNVEHRITQHIYKNENGNWITDIT